MCLHHPPGTRHLYTVPVFEQSVWIDAPVGSVFAFHERPDALSLLSPPFPPLRLLHRAGGLEPGARVELRIGPLPWTAIHTACEKNRFFVDEQLRGPFARWVHRHEFTPESSGTRLTDRIEFNLPGGRFIDALLGWAVRRLLQSMFRFRHSVTKRECERLARMSA
jgi:ligand-binding SRPBCC domain-containing protein